MVVLPPPLTADCFSFEFFHQFPFQKYAANFFFKFFKCNLTMFLGESRHSELIGPRFQRPILKKSADRPTDGTTDRRTDGPMDRRTDPLIEMRGRI